MITNPDQLINHKVQSYFNFSLCNSNVIKNSIIKIVKWKTMYII